eukprot:7478531-Lingulodinium_polyedra.AAC.1
MKESLEESRGMGQAHKWCKGTPQHGEVFVDRTDDPAAKVQGLARAWASKWLQDNEEVAGRAAAAFRALREEAKASGCPPGLLQAITGSSLRKASLAFKKGTSLGSDGVEFGWLRLLPMPILDSLAEVLREAVQELAAPLQLLLNVMHAIPKKVPGTHRLIG